MWYKIFEKTQEIQLASLKELDAALEAAQNDLQDLLNDIGKAQETNDPAFKTRIIKKIQEQMVSTARGMPFPVRQLN